MKMMWVWLIVAGIIGGGIGFALGETFSPPAACAQYNGVTGIVQCSAELDSGTSVQLIFAEGTSICSARGVVLSNAGPFVGGGEIFDVAEVQVEQANGPGCGNFGLTTLPSVRSVAWQLITA